MNTFKKKSLHAAVLAGLGALGAAGTADAVHLNPDGLGQVLIYPYYTARSAGAAAYNTAMSVVNSTNQTKLVKVRFLEGRNSREVLDFNLWLSPADIWTGVVVPTADGAKLITNDNSCVTPSDLFTRPDSTGAGFKNFQFSGTFQDGGPAELDRTREGYMEVIEMAVVTSTLLTGYAKHGATGVPANCPALDSYDINSGSGFVYLPGTYLSPPSGGLFGRELVLAAETGANYTLDATALDAWSDVVRYSQTGSLAPSLGLASPPVSNVFVGAGGSGSGVTGVVSTNWLGTVSAATPGTLAFSAAIMRNTVLNEFVLDANTASKTDWVLTFPTKRYFVNVGTGAATAPFNSNFLMPGPGSCDGYSPAVYNREEGTIGGPTSVILPSPLPPGQTIVGSNVCWEATVIPFTTSSLLGSINTSGLAPSIFAFVNGATTTPGSRTTPGLPTTQGPNGWMQIAFANGAVPVAPSIAPPAGAAFVYSGGAAAVATPGVHFGLPVISASFSNFNRAGVISQYGFASPAKYTRNIQ